MESKNMNLREVTIEHQLLEPEREIDEQIKC